MDWSMHQLCLERGIDPLPLWESAKNFRDTIDKQRTDHYKEISKNRKLSEALIRVMKFN